MRLIRLTECGQSGATLGAFLEALMRHFDVPSFFAVMAILEQDSFVSTRKGEWTDNRQNMIVARFQYIAQECINSGLLVSGQYASDAANAFLRSNAKPADLRIWVPQLRDRLKNEMAQLLYFEVPRERIAYWRDTELFGPNVEKKFPNALYDIEQASKCIVVERYTACVFHLMRAMEIAVQAFGRKVNAAAIDIHTDTWGQILDNIGPKVRGLPNTKPRDKKKKIKYENIYSHLDHIKRAWRNPTMHPKNQYDDPEAVAIFSAVKTFMQDLAKEL